jgi:hypothetical protein
MNGPVFRRFGLQGESLDLLSGLNGHDAYVMRGVPFPGNLDLVSWLTIWA